MIFNWCGMSSCNFTASHRCLQTNFSTCSSLIRSAFSYLSVCLSLYLSLSLSLSPPLSSSLSLSVFVQNMFLMAAMGPPGGGRTHISRRFQSRFSLINMTFPQVNIAYSCFTLHTATFLIPTISSLLSFVEPVMQTECSAEKFLEQP